ncbi:hypothetical protein [Hymenobacter psychrophilus]|uniref:Uncharacterized protein n=1 Tax=Hymenobacter psychrophilus TaxID=651662 RepID=A0A1H3G123_9BACT|nr:hypothetical protein [Hymenobacter psychrophilus]SDX96961.1 hypothetical protein SAMN04488069_104304 [Hymenobacter psychrophilus]
MFLTRFFRIALLVGWGLFAQRTHAQSQAQQLEQELDLVKMLPDSLDEHPGPLIVLPSASWGSSHKELPSDKGILYGSCVQRLGFSSGGIGQYVRIVNLDTRQYFRLNVKPIVRSRRENPFCYALPPGRYALINYEFAGGLQLGTESIRKHRNSQTLKRTRYLFTVLPGQLHYVGTWDFSQEFDPRFLDEKFTLDLVFQQKHPYLPLNQAIIVLPQ